jgi:hypothetical protein
MLEHVTDHEDRALARLIQQLKGKPRLAGLLRAFVSEVQAIEDALWQVFDQRLLDNAVGAQLDLLGRIVGREREGMADDSYRTHLRVQIRLNLGSGTARDVLETFALLVAGARLELVEQYPAAFALRVHEALPVDVADAATILQAAKAAGVRALLEYALCPDSEAFTTDGSGPGLGWGDATDATVGGKFAGAIETP